MKPKMTPCPTCRATGEIGGRECLACRGTGWRFAQTNELPRLRRMIAKKVRRDALRDTPADNGALS